MASVRCLDVEVLSSSSSKTSGDDSAYCSRSNLDGQRGRDLMHAASLRVSWPDRVD
jgi:hypothetical protein